MTHFIRTVTSTVALTVNRSSFGTFRRGLPIHARSIFSSAGIGIDNFKLAREQHLTRHAPSLDSFKKRFLDSVSNSNVQIFTEDLRNMIMAADNDQEIDAVVQALKKYNSSKYKFTDFHFGSPIMRLLYIHNKPDLAMQLFIDDELKQVFQDAGSALVLLNKLIEDKRYDDAIKIFEHGSERGFSTTTGRTYPSDVVMLAIEALYRQNTKQSFTKAKEVISKVMQRDADINPRTAAMIALLAIRQGEPAFALEIIGAVRTQNLTTIQNIRALCYAELGRVEEAINIVHLLADQPPIENDRRRVFSLVLQHIQKAIEQSKDTDSKARFEDLSKFVSTNDRLSTTDLTDFIEEPISRRGAVMYNRQGVKQMSSSSGNVRDSGFRGGFNQGSGYMRQGSGNNDYNRTNRRFGNDNYERRPQNTYVGNDRLSNRNQGSSFGESFRRENNLTQSNSHMNRNESGISRERRNDRNVSHRNENKPEPMETTSTSPIPQRVKQTTEDNVPKSRRKTDDQSSSFGKQDERQTGANTGIQQQSPWDDSTRRSA